MEQAAHGRLGEDHAPDVEQALGWLCGAEFEERALGSDCGRVAVSLAPTTLYGYSKVQPCVIQKEKCATLRLLTSSHESDSNESVVYSARAGLV